MAAHQLKVVAGALGRAREPKEAQARDAIAQRWRMGGLGTNERPSETGDVIPLLDGWIRRLEREAGLDPAANER